MATQIQIVPVGNLGNQMLQLMLVESMQQRVPRLDIGGIDLPDWGLTRKLSAPLAQRRLRLIGQHLDLALVERLLVNGTIRELELAALGFRMHHYLPRASYQPLFPRQETAMADGLADGLLINVRGAEILADTHPDYGPIPVHFYRQLVAATGLRPVFMGQIGNDAYSHAIRQAFPSATMLQSRGPMGDFELIRSARHVVTSVSTFSWLAAWLSDAQTIHMPVFGMFNPAQREDIDLLPLDDPRYRFYAFPVRHWKGTPAQFEALVAPADFPVLTVDAVRKLLDDAARRLAPRARLYRHRLLVRALLHRWVGIAGRVGLRP